MSEQLLIGVLSLLTGWLARHWGLGMGSSSTGTPAQPESVRAAAHPILADIVGVVRAVIRDELDRRFGAAPPAPPTKPE